MPIQPLITVSVEPIAVTLRRTCCTGVDPVLSTSRAAVENVEAPLIAEKFVPSSDPVSCAVAVPVPAVVHWSCKEKVAYPPPKSKLVPTPVLDWDTNDWTAAPL